MAIAIGQERDLNFTVPSRWADKPNRISTTATRVETRPRILALFMSLFTPYGK